MLKVLGRIAIILLATALVVGLTYVIAQNVNISLPGGRGGDEFGERPAPGNFNPDSAASGTLPDRPQGGGEFRGGRGGEREGGSAFGWMEVLKSLGVIALVTAGVVVVQNVFERVRRLRKLHATSQPGI
jgi:hypothetical protein